jgi:hypothetical protein
MWSLYEKGFSVFVFVVYQFNGSVLGDGAVTGCHLDPRAGRREVWKTGGGYCGLSLVSKIPTRDK